MICKAICNRRHLSGIKVSCAAVNFNQACFFGVCRWLRWFCLDCKQYHGGHWERMPCKAKFLMMRFRHWRKSLSVKWIQQSLLEYLLLSVLFSFSHQQWALLLRVSPDNCCLVFSGFYCEVLAIPFASASSLSVQCSANRSVLAHRWSLVLMLLQSSVDAGLLLGLDRFLRLVVGNFWTQS